MTEARKHYHIELKRKKGEGFVARCIELPGCLSEGKTKKEALKNIQDAVKLYTEDVEAEIKEKQKNAIVIQV